MKIMQGNSRSQIEKDLHQIADMLLLNGTLTECPGLLHGKMGIAIFFFHYTKFTGNGLFADYAMDVIGEMLDQIHVNSPADYENGLAGIGVGFDYLIQNGFLCTEDDICEDFDSRMYQAVMYDPCSNFGLYGGLTGYGRYWLTRLRYPESAVLAQECLLRITVQVDTMLPNILIAEQSDVFGFLSNMQKLSGFDQYTGLLEKCRKEWSFSEPLRHEIENTLQQIPNLDMKKAPVNTGLLGGYAQEGMLRLTALGQTDASWINLL